MTKRKHLTQDDYDQIKLLAAAGLKHSLIVEVTQRSHGTVTRVKTSNSYEEYRKTLSEMNAMYHARAAAKAGKPVEQAPTENVEIPDFLRDDYKPSEGPVLNRSEVMQERMVIALERLADAWERQPEKKLGLFK